MTGSTLLSCFSSLLEEPQLFLCFGCSSILALSSQHMHYNMFVVCGDGVKKLDWGHGINQLEDATHVLVAASLCRGSGAPDPTIEAAAPDLLCLGSPSHSSLANLCSSFGLPSIGSGTASIIICRTYTSCRQID
uniref:Uncharacterized protein n=1 Tax=Aegilops tauschii subsp. strangulata TaxID=200361 RepID=A0A453EJW6_AEGTS